MGSKQHTHTLTWSGRRGGRVRDGTRVVSDDERALHLEFGPLVEGGMLAVDRQKLAHKGGVRPEERERMCVRACACVCVC